jgi:hypothetical protein
MGKKRTRKTVTSKGQRRNIVAGVKEVRQARSAGEVAYNKLEAWRKGQNPWITVPGPSTKCRLMKVKANAVWGNPKNRSTSIYSKVTSDG